MIDEVARLGWLELERYCTTHSDRRVWDCARAPESTKPDGGCWVMSYTFNWIKQLSNGKVEVYAVSRFFYLDDIRKN